jgi:hypothetical protein
MYTVRRKQNEDNEVRNQESGIERVRVIEALKRPVEKMLPEILGEAARNESSDET